MWWRDGVTFGDRVVLTRVGRERTIVKKDKRVRITKTKLTDDELLARLRELEMKYEMDSATFYARYSKGEMDDRKDFVRWAGLCNMSALARDPQPARG